MMHGRRALVAIHKPTKRLVSSRYLILTEQAGQSGFQLSSLSERPMPHVAVWMEIYHEVHKTYRVDSLFGHQGRSSDGLPQGTLSRCQT